MVNMLPQFKGLQTRMVKKTLKELPKTKRCPKCHKNRNIKMFGVRTQHAKNGKPERTMVQSWCKKCRRTH